MKNKQKKKNLLHYLSLCASSARLLFFLFKSKKKHNPHFCWKEIAEKLHKIKHDKSGEKHVFRDFIKEEEQEVEKFIFGKESFIEFFEHTSGFLKDSFIPHEGNGHKPKVLRPKSLLSIAFALFTMKMFLGGYLFLAFPDSAFMSENIAVQVIELLNRDRAKNDRVALTRDSELTRAAKEKAEDMIALNYFDHYGPDGKKPWEWIHRTDYDYIFAGENLAMNFTTAESVHAALMNSESHRKNILSDKYLDIGVAMVTGEINGKRTNILVQTFGHKRKAEVVVEEVLKVEPLELAEAVVEKTVTQAPVVKAVAEEAVAEVVDNEVPVTPTKPVIPELKPKPKPEPVTPEPEQKIIPTPTPTPILKPEIEGEQELEPEPVEALTREVLAVEPLVTPARVDSLETIQSVKAEIATADVASSSLEYGEIAAVKRKVSILVRDVVLNEPEVLAEKNYLEIDNNTLVTVSAVPEIVGQEAIATHNKMRLVRYAFITLVSVIVVLLLLNIFVKVRVQHKSVIVQTLFTIVFIVALIVFKFHYLESDLADILLM